MTFKIPILAAVVCSLAVMCVALPASAATLTTGYTIGASSQLLSANGGAGDTLFNDNAQTGGDDLNDADGFATFFTALLPGAGLWNVGETVSITGVAFPIRGAGTDTGTFTFDIREASGGSGTTGGGGLGSLGTATASYTTTTTGTFFVNFDTPVTFVVDSNSTSIGINIKNSGKIGLKDWIDNVGGAGAGERLLRYNYGNGNTPNRYFNISVAGTVAPVPEPASVLLGALGLIGIATTRRR